MKRVAIIGAGPAGLFAAEYLSAKGFAVTVFDKKKAPARKFLLAGRGGLNLTHSEPVEDFVGRYGAASEFLSPAIGSFTPSDLRRWSGELGQETFVGSSGRVFPKSLKASPLLRVWLARLTERNVAFRFGMDWQGWDKDRHIVFKSLDGNIEAVEADAVLLALGGASWPELGSDGRWIAPLQERSIAVAPLLPSNCGFACAWSDYFRTRFAGTPLKSIVITAGGRTVRGEAMIDKDGIEGGAIYALSPAIRDEIVGSGHKVITLDLKPGLGLQEIERRLSASRRRQSFSTFVQKSLGLPPVAIALLHEVSRDISSLPQKKQAALVKSLPLTLTAPFPIERAISSAGGILLRELDENYMLTKIPGLFAAGEMLDWEAPTGGYLLQACFSTGFTAACGIERYLK